MIAEPLTDAQLERITSVRRMATAASVFAAGVSLAANVYASERGPVGWAVGATAPVVFVFAIELATKTPSLATSTVGRLRAALRSMIAAGIGLGAAFVSFSHLAEVVRSVGETGPVAIVLPLLVDLVVVVGVLTQHDTTEHLRQHDLAVAAHRQAAETAARAEAEAEAREATEAAERERRQAERTAARRDRARAEGHDPGAGGVIGDDPSLAPALRARQLAAANPDLTQAEIGELIGRSERTVRRYLEATPTPATTDTGTDTDSDAGAVDAVTGDGTEGVTAAATGSSTGSPVEDHTATGVGVGLNGSGPAPAAGEPLGVTVR